MVGRIGENIIHVAAVVGYMWAGWLSSMDRPWYEIVIILIFSALFHMAGVHNAVLVERKEWQNKIKEDN